MRIAIMRAGCGLWKRDKSVHLHDPDFSFIDPMNFGAWAMALGTGATPSYTGATPSRSSGISAGGLSV